MGSFAGFHFQSKSQLISFMANRMRAYCGNCCEAFSGVRVHVRILYRVAVDADTFCLATSVSANSPILYNGNVYGYGGMRVENCIFYSPRPHHCHTKKYWFDKKTSTSRNCSWNSFRCHQTWTSSLKSLMNLSSFAELTIVLMIM